VRGAKPKRLPREKKDDFVEIILERESEFAPGSCLWRNG
jgi:hypothetical protein